MKGFIVLLVAAVCIEGYFAENAGPLGNLFKEMTQEIPQRFLNDISNHKIAARDVSYGQPNVYADSDGARYGNGHFFGQSFSFSEKVDKDGKVTRHGLQVTNNDGEKSVNRF